MDSVGRVSRVRPIGGVETGVVEDWPWVWLGERWTWCFGGALLVLSEHSCGVGVIGMQVQPPLDRSALMSLGHAAVLEQQEPHLCVRAALDLVR